MLKYLGLCTYIDILWEPLGHWIEFYPTAQKGKGTFLSFRLSPLANTTKPQPTFDLSEPLPASILKSHSPSIHNAPHCISLNTCSYYGTQTRRAHGRMSELLGDLLITVLFGTQASFTHPGIILPAKETLGDQELKTIVRKSQRNKSDRLVEYSGSALEDIGLHWVPYGREVLGYSVRVWRALTETLRSGNEQLMENKHHLLSKIADLTSLGRNLLVAKERAQDLCAYVVWQAARL